MMTEAELKEIREHESHGTSYYGASYVVDDIRALLAHIDALTALERDSTEHVSYISKGELKKTQDENYALRMEVECRDAQIADLRQHVDKWMHDYYRAFDKNKALEAEGERLKGMLRSVVAVVGARTGYASELAREVDAIVNP